MTSPVEDQSTNCAEDGTKESHKIAFAGGLSTENMTIQTFNPEINTWSYEEFPRPSKKRLCFGLTVSNKNMIIAGGKIEGLETDSVECLDLQSMQWTDLPPMKLKRWRFAMSDFNGNLYVVGGFSDGRWTTSVEKFDFSSHEWQEMEPMPLPFKEVQVDVFNGSMYAVGWNSSSMYSYNFLDNQWTARANRNEESERFGFAAVGKFLYAVGGWYKEQSKTVDRYDPSTDAWTVISSLSEERYNIRCAALNNRLVVCGGYNRDDEWLNLVDEYNPETNTWSSLVPLLSHSSDVISLQCMFTM